MPGPGHTAGKALDPGRIAYKSVLGSGGTDGRRALQVDIGIRRYFGISGHIRLAVVAAGGLVAHAEGQIGAGAHHAVTGVLDPNDLRLGVAVHLAVEGHHGADVGLQGLRALPETGGIWGYIFIRLLEI